MNNPTITPEFEQFLDIANNSNEHIFLTGDAGAGKSTLVEYFIKNTKKNVVVLAPTGVAAINVGGQTLHSFFGFGIKLSTVATKFNEPELSMLRKVRTIVLDEISMVRADILDRIDKTLRKNVDPEYPFGGIQIIMVGDLYQLPPVVTEGEVKEFIEKRYKTPYFFSANVWANDSFHKMKLTHIFRQKEENFKKVLTAVKYGNIDQRRINVINNVLHNKNSGSTETTLCSYRKTAEQINTIKLSEIKEKSRIYWGKLEGDFREVNCPVPKRLELKVGAKVMICINNMDEGYVNGTTGTIIEMSDNTLTINSEGNEIELNKFEFTQTKYKLIDNRVINEESGKFTQFPIMLAWGITIHKSQGKTLDKYNIDLGYGAFAPGQLYVALSRGTKSSGINFVRPVKLSDVKVCSDVIKFDKA